MKVVCIGDSNTYGYDPRSYWGDRYPKDSRWVDLLAAQTGWEVYNQGENGRTIPAGPVLLPQDINLLIVMLGTNDLLQGAPPETTAEKMKHFLLGLGLPREKLLLVAPPPMARGEWVPTTTLVEASLALARYYRELAQALHVRFADAGMWNISLAYDGVHFTEQGHRDFAAGLGKVLYPQRERRPSQPCIHLP